MQTFVITFVACTVLSIGLWNFGLAGKIWPTHPFFATVIIAAGLGILVQLILTQDAARRLK